MSSATGDTGVLDENGPFLEGRPVNPEDDSYYRPAGALGREASALRALRACHPPRSALRRHGLPLIGSGDWNDGMNRVGILGAAKASGWASSSATCSALQRTGAAHGDAAFAEFCAEGARCSARNGDARWDGAWYRRAYFDDGTPLGTARATNAGSTRSRRAGRCCRGARSERARRPCRRSTSDWCGARTDSSSCSIPRSTNRRIDPGYIRGYVPGVRENGGQYTHAAIWAAMAFAALGRRKRAWELTR
jgi:cyclic beta-1,2-glucan synthetase